MASRGNSIKHNVPPGYYLASDAAKIVDMPLETLRGWLKSKYYVPQKFMKSGQLTIALYDDHDIEELRQRYSYRVRKEPNP